MCHSSEAGGMEYPTYSYGRIEYCLYEVRSFTHAVTIHYWFEGIQFHCTQLAVDIVATLSVLEAETNDGAWCDSKLASVPQIPRRMEGTPRTHVHGKSRIGKGRLPNGGWGSVPTALRTEFYVRCRRKYHRERTHHIQK
eukprot:scaffold141499_cov44-Attheya_sp.AAC.1